MVARLTLVQVGLRSSRRDTSNLKELIMNLPKSWVEAEKKLDEKYGEDRHETAFNCVVTKGMRLAVEQWLNETVYPEVIKFQKEYHRVNGFPVDEFKQAAWDEGYPYEGAIGGGLSYRFTQTSIGDIVTAHYDTFNQNYKLELVEHCNL